MKKTFIVFAIAAIALISCNNSGSSGSSSNSSPILNSNPTSNSGTVEKQKTPKELKAELKQQELANPTGFLSASGNYRQNFWGDKFKVNCAITNKATVATFKDAIVKVTYYSKTKTILTTNEYTVYEFFPPNTTKTVPLTINNYKDVSSIGWDVIDATAVRN